MLGFVADRPPPHLDLAVHTLPPQANDLSGTPLTFLRGIAPSRLVTHNEDPQYYVSQVQGVLRRPDTTPRYPLTHMGFLRRGCVFPGHEKISNRRSSRKIGEMAVPKSSTRATSRWKITRGMILPGGWLTIHL